MSKEIAAAILTKLYYEQTAGAKQELQAHKEKFHDNVDTIGKVYARFLARHDNFALASRPVK